MWKTAQEALPLGENREKRRMFDHTACTFCGDRETAIHLFALCPFIAKIWDLVPLQHRPTSAANRSFASYLQASKKFICLPPTGASSANIFPWLCWAIWITRNKRIFDNKILSPEDIISKAISEAVEWQSAQQQQQQQQQQESQKTWYASPTTNSLII